MAQNDLEKLFSQLRYQIGDIMEFSQANSLSFRGCWTHKLNSAGRISVPSKFRDVLNKRYSGEHMVLVSAKNCLVAYPILEWEKKEDQLLSLPIQSSADMMHVRLLLASAEDVSIGSGGRLLIPLQLREKVGLQSECVILGMINRFEIWDAKCWTQASVDYLNHGDGSDSTTLGDDFNEFLL